MSRSAAARGNFRRSVNRARSRGIDSRSASQKLNQPTLASSNFGRISDYGELPETNAWSLKRIRLLWGSTSNLST